MYPQGFPGSRARDDYNIVALLPESHGLFGLDLFAGGIGTTGIRIICGGGGMSMKYPPLKVESYISIDGAEPIPFNSLSEEEKTRCRKIMIERAKKALEDAIRQRPEICGNFI